jgi:peptidyl-lysine (3S)-dioxygenase / protease
MDLGPQEGVESKPSLIIKPDRDAEAVPFAVWDPDRPAEHSTPFSKLTKPIHVDLNAGDMLYLPSLW